MKIDMSCLILGGSDHLVRRMGFIEVMFSMIDL
jgi:hypothetical protein